MAHHGAPQQSGPLRRARSHSPSLDGGRVGLPPHYGMLFRLRDTLFRAITTSRGDSFAAVRIPKEIARDLNITLGTFLAPHDELTRRSEAGVRLAQLRAAGVVPPRAPSVAAPVLVYFEKDRNIRELARIGELLDAKGIAWKQLDVAGDEVTLNFVTLKARCENDELPVVFVADTPVGGYDTLVSADISGELARLVHPL
jgi:hypothetical protein